MEFFVYLYHVQVYHIVAIFIEIVNQCVWASGAMYNFDWDVGVPCKLKF